MRVALVSPYSWTYPGGVTRHIEALATELDREGHEVRVLAPYDEDTRRTRLAHRGARPQVRDVPEWLGGPRGGEGGGRHRGGCRAAGRWGGPPPAPPPICPARRARSPRCAASCAPGSSTSCTSTSRWR